MMTTNKETYKQLLRSIIDRGSNSPEDDIAGEILGAVAEFDPNSEDIPANEAYVKAELAWYDTQDLCIKGHPLIETNPIWQKVATADGRVNSNYGWCLFSPENYRQFDNALKAFKENRFTKRATMIYSRPQIHFDWNDGYHADHDNICTVYTQAELRFINHKYVLDYHVHMRSNDAWFGMRNDYRWHKLVMTRLQKEIQIMYGIEVTLGTIRWFADSLHIYKFAVPMVNDFLTKE